MRTGYNIHLDTIENWHPVTEHSLWPSFERADNHRLADVLSEEQKTVSSSHLCQCLLQRGPADYTVDS